VSFESTRKVAAAAFVRDEYSSSHPTDDMLTDHVRYSTTVSVSYTWPLPAERHSFHRRSQASS
jgi:hypothetical protein